MIEALDIHVQGIVQGRGFRPFVYRLAKRYLVNGWVLNAVDGVHIHAEGESKLLDEFVLELSDNPPAASQVREIDIAEVPLEDFTAFEIRFSDDAASRETTLVSPDLATCDDCLAELFDRVTDAIATRSSTAPTAGPVSPSSRSCPTIAPRRR